MIRKIGIIVVLFWGVSIFSPLLGQINAGQDQEICLGERVWLKATADGSFAQRIFLSDDTVAGPYPIGFPFEFYGVSYDEFYISDNGWISFMPPYPDDDSWNGGESPKPLPSSEEVIPKNCVMGVWQDWSPAYSGSVGYETKGTAPNRMLVISYCQVATYNCESLEGTFQIVLRESVNFIEVHLAFKPFCAGWYDGKAVMGVHNIDGTEGVVVPNRNATQWVAADESWRFTPSGGSYNVTKLSNYSPVVSGVLGPISWYANSINNTNYLGTSDSLKVWPSSTTTYIAEASVCGGLSFSDDVEVVVHPLPEADAGRDTTIVVNTAAQLNGENSHCVNGGCVYHWEPVDAIYDDPSLPKPTTDSLYYTTEYYLWLEDQFGCRSDSDRVVVSVVNGPLGLLLQADRTAICRGTEVTVTAVGCGGQWPYSYQWSSVPPPSTSYPQDSFLRVQPDTTTVFLCRITDANGMTIPADSITISIENPRFDISGPSLVCENEMGVIYTTAMQGMNNYLWRVENGTIQGANVDTVIDVSWNGSGVGRVILQEVLPPPLGCASEDTLEVQILSRPSPVVSGPNTVCENQQGVVYSVMNVLADREYDWLVNGGSITSQNQDTAYVPIDWGSAGEGKVVVTENLVAHPACKSSQVLDVTILPGPQPSVVGPQLVCEREYNLLYTSNASDNVRCEWQDIHNGVVVDSLDKNNRSIQWQVAGEGYIVVHQIIDSSLCSAFSDTLFVTVNPAPQMTISPSDLFVCEHEEVVLEALGADTLWWYPSIGLSAQDQHRVSLHAASDVTYFVEGINGYGCRDTARTTLHVTPVPRLDLGADRYIRKDDPIVLFAGDGNDYYEWQDSSHGAEFVAYSGGEYYVYVEKNGCFATDTVRLFLTMGDIPLPTAFTPNGDGINDDFRLYGELDRVAQFSIQIYARDGQLVYASNDVFEGWDGRDLHGQLLPVGTYAYVIEIMEQGNPFNQGPIVRRGSVTLLR